MPDSMVDVAIYACGCPLVPRRPEMGVAADVEGLALLDGLVRGVVPSLVIRKFSA